MPIIGGLLAALAQIAVGLLFAAVLCDWRGPVTRGSLFLTGGSGLLAAALAYGLGGLARIEGAERAGQLGLLIGLLLYCLLCAAKRSGPRSVSGLVGLASGLAALGLAAAA